MTPWIARIEAALAPEFSHVASDFDLNRGMEPPGLRYRDAAVLMPIVERQGAAHLILTRRTDHLPAHAGQVAFPGGKIDQGETVIGAALREAHEEIGLDAARVHVIGCLDAYRTGTGFEVAPVVGLITSQFIPQPNPDEVAEVFEVPLDFLMDHANHERHSRDFAGRTRHFYAMNYDRHFIWGATAGMIRNLANRIQFAEGGALAGSDG